MRCAERGDVKRLVKLRGVVLNHLVLARVAIAAHDAPCQMSLVCQYMRPMLQPGTVSEQSVRIARVFDFNSYPSAWLSCVIQSMYDQSGTRTRWQPGPGLRRKMEVVGDLLEHFIPSIAVVVRLSRDPTCSTTVRREHAHGREGRLEAKLAHKARPFVNTSQLLAS